jgi:hypothetical protein
LCVLIFNFPVGCLRGTIELLSHKTPRITRASADDWQ